MIIFFILSNRTAEQDGRFPFWNWKIYFPGYFHDFQSLFYGKFVEFCNLFDRTAEQDGKCSPCIVEPVLNLFQTCFCPLSFVGGACFWACFLLCGPVLGRLSLLRTCFKPVLCGGGGLLLGLLSPVWACSGPAFSSENLFQTCFGPLFPMRDYSA
jgi:hypothetical protein